MILLSSLLAFRIMSERSNRGDWPTAADVLISIFMLSEYFIGFLIPISTLFASNLVNFYISMIYDINYIYILRKNNDISNSYLGTYQDAASSRLATSTTLF